MEIVRSPPDEETKGVMEITRLFFIDRSMKSCYLDLDGKVYPGSQIGWVTSTALHLKYGDSLIGKLKVPDVPMILDDEGYFKTDWFESEESEESEEPEMTIKNMRAFKCFFRDVMSQKDENNQAGIRGPLLADLSVSKDGHALTMSIDLSHSPSMKATVTWLTINGSTINVAMSITNESPLEIFFEHCTFKLKQNQRTIGELYGDLSILPGKSEVKFRGSIQDGVSGMAILKGDGYSSCDCDESWKKYAIKLFEAEVNLDKRDAGDADHDDVVGDKDDE